MFQTVRQCGLSEVTSTFPDSLLRPVTAPNSDLELYSRHATLTLVTSLYRDLSPLTPVSLSLSKLMTGRTSTSLSPANMVSECFESPIERPSGISGYRPGSWCSVCGRTETLAGVKQCTKEGCTNVCHLHCLGAETDFRCGNTGQLRALLGISDPVTPYTSNTQVPSDPPAPRDPVEEEPEDDLCDLQKE